MPVFDRELGTNAAFEKLPIPIKTAHGQNVGHIAMRAHRLIREPHAGRRFQWCWKLQPHIRQAILITPIREASRGRACATASQARRHRPQCGWSARHPREPTIGFVE
jgi:hypothetical protein